MFFGQARLIPEFLSSTLSWVSELCFRSFSRAISGAFTHAFSCFSMQSLIAKATRKARPFDHRILEKPCDFSCLFGRIIVFLLVFFCGFLVSFLAALSCYFLLFSRSLSRFFLGRFLVLCFVSWEQLDVVAFQPFCHTHTQTAKNTKQQHHTTSIGTDFRSLSEMGPWLHSKYSF